jgi:hypothetical protein
MPGRLRGLVDPPPQASRVLLVTGEAGMGKTVLLADAAGRARRAGMRVLPVAGRESESRLAFAGLQAPLATIALTQPSGVPAWQTIPSWAVVGTADHHLTLSPGFAGAGRAAMLARTVGT